MCGKRCEESGGAINSRANVKPISCGPPAAGGGGAPRGRVSNGDYN